MVACACVCWVRHLVARTHAHIHTTTMQRRGMVNDCHAAYAHSRHETHDIHRKMHGICLFCRRSRCLLSCLCAHGTLALRPVRVCVYMLVINRSEVFVRARAYIDRNACVWSLCFLNGFQRTLDWLNEATRKYALFSCATECEEKGEAQSPKWQTQNNWKWKWKKVQLGRTLCGYLWPFESSNVQLRKLLESW